MLRWMVEESSGIGSGLSAQLERTTVAARCGCGCASIDLAVDGTEEDKKEPMDLIADYAWKTKRAKRGQAADIDIVTKLNGAY